MVHKHFDVSAAVKINLNIFSITRGNKYKLQKHASHYNLRKFSFCSLIAIAHIWKCLLVSVVDADMINTFKSRLDKNWIDEDVVYHFNSKLNRTGGASGVCDVVQDKGKENTCIRLFTLDWIVLCQYFVHVILVCLSSILCR